MIVIFVEFIDQLIKYPINCASLFLISSQNNERKDEQSKSSMLHQLSRQR